MNRARYERVIARQRYQAKQDQRTILIAFIVIIVIASLLK